MEKYNKYKDSGIKWLGEIPEHWDDSHLKRVCRLIKDGTHASFKRVDKDGFPLLSVRNIVNNQFINLNDDSLISKEDYLSIVKSFKICEGDIQLAIVGATMGKVAVVPKLPPFATQRSVATIRVNDKYLFNRFLFYFIQGVKFQGYLWNNTNYSAQPGIYLGAIQTTSVFVPPLKEQTQIANYLDAKTTAIDKKVNLLQQKIKHYKAYRKTLINEIVTKGLDKTVKLKDSGISWIGEIPEHWEVKRLKDILRKKITDGPHETPEFTKEGYPFMSVDGIQDGELTFEGCRFISENDFKKYSKKVVIERNDLFMGKAASTGKIARVKVDFPFTVWSPIAVIKVLKTINSTFMEYFFKSEKVQVQIDFLCTHNTQKNIAMKDIPKIMLVLPPFKEQQQIADYLDAKTATIDKIVKNIETQIATLKELRKTLINEVVTGKVKVIKSTEIK
ncbi:restriction endonuclease subunit S [Kordia jejudonensis]|uniref:restriction endonuclease subunit S n=1 Tax=Kordia jejudonensis TaxID=1348245 RepID=UPI000629531F|nr:restriction endonuclease subunit S [Kordia jejudonensis]